MGGWGRGGGGDGDGSRLRGGKQPGSISDAMFEASVGQANNTVTAIAMSAIIYIYICCAFSSSPGPLQQLQYR